MSSRTTQKRRARSLRRKPPARKPYYRVLVVCEGSKTEPLYLRELIDDLELSTANISIFGDGGSSPKSVVEYAKKLYKREVAQGGKYDRVYCVFDRDSHSSYLHALEAIRSAMPKATFYPANSVPCFEYWALLHFEYTTQAFARTGSRSPCDQVISRLEGYMPDYTKGDGTLYESVKNYTDTAIERAERANSSAEESGTENPSTLVGEMVGYLRSIKSLHAADSRRS